MSTPTLPTLNLAEDEKDQAVKLLSRLNYHRFGMELRDLYFRGEQAIRQLGISIPPQLAGLRTVVGWPGIAVEAVEERLDIEGFRYPDQAGGDEDLWAIWQYANLDEESQLAHLDALIFGRSFVVVGSGDDDGEPPIITVESPLDMAVDYDPRTRRIRAALRLFDYDGERAIQLYLPDATITAKLAAGGDVEVIERDDHRLGQVLVARIANRQRTHDRDGASEITSDVMSITDAACRTLIGTEVSREFYGAPQRYILGASESDFQAPDGTPKSAWETYIGRLLALERDDQGNVPQVGQFAAASPSPYVEVLNMYARLFASRIGLPPHYLGFTTDNPASADAIRSSEARLVKRAERKQRAFGGPWEQVMRLALLVRDGQVPAPARRIETIWRDAATPTQAAQADATGKMVQAGIWVPDSDVTLERSGLTTGEIVRMKADRRRGRGAAALADLARQARELSGGNAGG